MNTSQDLSRLTAARDKLAGLVLQDEAFAPFFRRIEEEIALERGKLNTMATAARIVRRRADMARFL